MGQADQGHRPGRLDVGDDACTVCARRAPRLTHRPRAHQAEHQQHQEDNAKIFEEKKAAVILDQRGLAAGTLKDEIVELLDDKEKKEGLSRNIRQIFKQNPGQEIVRIIEDLLRKN